MAYIVGLMTHEEKKEMEKRGWEFEAPPKELIPEESEPDQQMCMVFVDASMFDVMNGPDWEQNHVCTHNHGTRGGICEDCGEEI